ncbi:unnamed protein product [Blepharisma stoltei]|uniref:Mitochondrial carrier protein n=1 Tax=Blepharisma stoltei TaxID=1481888 RepID=A0AAU9K266_9CILI|nr:unnamed protein product [Blepharisma stoltei]
MAANSSKPSQEVPLDTPKHIHTVPIPIPITSDDEKFWHLLTGGISGAVSRTATSPLERLKILRQCSTPEYEGLNFFRAMIKFHKLEGFRGYFKGNGSNVLKIVPFSALEFYTFEMAKTHIVPHDKPRHKGWLLFSGSLSGIVAQIATYPLDLVRTILSIKTDQGHKIFPELKKVYQNKGFTGLYTGLNMSLLGIAPFIGFKMATFDVLKARYLPDPKNSNFMIMNLILGGLAGGIAMVLTYPTDLIRRKIQLCAFFPSKDIPYRTIAQCCRHIWNTEGYYGFYRGMVPSFVKVIPSMAIVFATNEQLKHWMHVK